LYTISKDCGGKQRRISEYHGVPQEESEHGFGRAERVEAVASFFHRLKAVRKRTSKKEETIEKRTKEKS